MAEKGKKLEIDDRELREITTYEKREKEKGREVLVSNYALIGANAGVAFDKGHDIVDVSDAAQRCKDFLARHFGATFDRDGDGFLDDHELLKLMQTIANGREVSEDDVTFVVEQCDKNHDGHVTPAEFKKCYHE